ncbi:MAG TPA: HAD family hydrolase [Solirubrobacteraceae bacterium]
MRAVLLDGLGTLLELLAPWHSLEERMLAAGLEISSEQARRAFAAEIDYYQDHHLEGTDENSLADLRARCASVLHGALPASLRDALSSQDARRLLLDCLRFSPYPEVPAALLRLRLRGRRLIVVSNWDISLHEVVRNAGLSDLLDGVVSSAEVGQAKPAGAVFKRALALAGVTPAQAVHVGDSLVNDVQGALSVGVAPILLCRSSGAPRQVPAGVPVISSLTQLDA